MANDNIFERFGGDVVNINISDTTDGARGAIGDGIGPIFKNDSNLGKSLNEYAAKMFDNNLTDLSKGIGSFKEIMKVVLTDATSLSHALKPTDVQLSKTLNQNTFWCLTATH